MGERAKEIVWQHDAPSVVFITATGPKIESWVSLIFIVWSKHAEQNACCSRRISLSVEQGLVEREWCCAEYFVRRARVDKEANHCAYD